jgi:hypothetical protein
MRATANPVFEDAFLLDPAHRAGVDVRLFATCGERQRKCAALAGIPGIPAKPGGKEK